MVQPAVTRAPTTPSEPLVVRYRRMASEDLESRSVDAYLRTLDLVIGGVAVVILSPAILGIGMAIRLTSGRPVFYQGERVGRAGEVFTMVKFRTLQADAESRLGPFFGAQLDHLTGGEMTRLGRLLRACHLDELPQLWNVLRGEMSIVGPRPIRPIFFERLCAEIPEYWQRLVVAPGMTGFAQMRMRRDMSWAEKLVHDLEYIADRSVHLYLRVVAETACLIVTLPVRRILTRHQGAG